MHVTGGDWDPFKLVESKRRDLGLLEVGGVASEGIAHGLCFLSGGSVHGAAGLPHLPQLRGRHRLWVCISAHGTALG